MKNESVMDIGHYIRNKSLVKIDYYEQDIYCQILDQSNEFLLIRDIKDWHFDGYMIFKKESISGIEYTRLTKFKEKVISSKASLLEIRWLDISSFDTILSSLYNNYNRICIEGADRDVDQFVLGKIDCFDQESIDFSKVDVYGNINPNAIHIPIQDITCIFFLDEYSRVLFDYINK